MLGLLAWFSAVAVKAQLEQAGRAARPIGSPSDWISSDDYPKSALREGAEGKTGFILDVTPDGRVADCNVTKASGNDGLDAATCALLRDRGRFTPALDEKGRPTVGTYRSSVAWQIPRGAPLPLAPMSAAFTFNVDGRGHAINCGTTGSVGGGTNMAELCRLIVAQALFVPEMREGKPVTKHVVVRFSVEISDPPATPAN